MLRSFRVGNHRSFRDEQELLLMPARPGDERPVVPVAAIYGANASGKSNLLDGLWSMRAVVVDSVRALEKSDSFRMDGMEAERPSSFIVELVLGDTRYTYGFVVLAGAVEQEWLYSYPEKRRRVLFERNHGTIKFGSTVSDLKAKFSTLEELIRPDVLILGMCNRLSLGPLMPVFHWFEKDLCVHHRAEGDLDHVLEERIGVFLERGPEHSRRLLSLLVAADVGITDIELERAAAPVAPALGYATLGRTARAHNDHSQLVLKHGGRGTPFRLTEESAGTLNWLDLLPEVIDVLDAGRVFVVDEIDGSLHPRLTAKLIELFQSEETNRHGAQLIFTTHDTSLLGTMLGGDLLDRDQVWFVEKDPEGVSGLYPLTDFKPRKDQNTERRYLAGSYGAVPVLGDFVEAVLGR